MNATAHHHGVDYGRTGTKAARTRQVVHELLLEHAGDGGLPTNARFVFYELEQAGNATKPDPDDNRRNRRRSIGWPPGSQDTTDALTWLRDEGIVPWEWIADEERRLTEWSYAATVSDYMRDRLGEAIITPWGDELPPLILCESKATAGVLRSVVSEYVCPIAGTKGQAAGFLRTVIAPLLLAGDRTILYLGDLDKQGADIEGNTRRVLEEATGSVFHDDSETLAGGILWQRLGLTEEQAQAAEIEPIWKVDGRTGEGHWATEVESLGQPGVIALVRDELLPEPLDSVHEREQEQREAIAELIANLDGGAA